MENSGGLTLRVSEIEKIYGDYMTKNRRYLEMNNLMDAAQEAFMYIVKRNQKGNLEKLNSSFISRGILMAKLNELRNKNNKVGHLEDIINTQDEIKVEDIIGEIDKNMQHVDINIDIEEKIARMTKKDSKVADIIKFHLEGWKGKEIAKMFGVSKTVISRIINAQTRQNRKKSHGSIKKDNLEKFIKIAKKYGKKTKHYVRVGDIVLYYNGRIFDKKGYFGGHWTGADYLNYVDVINIKDFENACKNTKKHVKGSE